MITILYLPLFILGTIIGSFLNVIILRFHTGRGVNGRSGCFSCGNTLHWYELIPVLSFSMQKGRCRNCKSRISIQYPLVELLTGFIFCVVVYSQNISLWSGITLLLLAFDLAIWATLIVVLVYDLKHMIIPDVFSALFALLTFGKLGMLYSEGRLYSGEFTSHIIAALALSGFFAFLWLVSKGKWIGLGDSKLAVGMGLYLGLAQGLSAFVYAFWVGAGFAIIGMAIQKVLKGRKSLGLKTEIPFAPLLILGTLIAFLFQSDVFHLTVFFS